MTKKFKNVRHYVSSVHKLYKLLNSLWKYVKLKYFSAKIWEKS